AYYARHILLPGVGLEGQRKLKGARVVVIGAGGLGCPVLQALAGAGVGRISVVDGDQVSLSNLSRQWLHAYSDIGRNKAESACEEIAAFNPLIEVSAIPVMLTAANARAIIEPYDIVVDATDNLATRYLMDDVCGEFGLPWVHAALYRESAQMTIFWKQCSTTFRKLYPEPSVAPSCSGAGMLGACASLVGNLQALEVIKLISGNGRPAVGELVSIDSKELAIRSFKHSDVSAPTPIRDEHNDYSKHSISAEQFNQLRSIHAPMSLVDIRSASEYAELSLGGAIHLPAETILESGLPDEVKDAPRIVLICVEGTVSSILADALRSQDVNQVFYLEGGLRSREGLHS
ncbi:MAG: ThiF family adenylyltransferase, partial [Opitutales bacterium]